MDNLDQRLQTWLLAKSAASIGRRVRATNLLSAAVNALNSDLVDTRAAFRELRKSGFLDYAPDIAGLPYTGFVTISPPARAELPSAIAWRAALESRNVDPELLSALLPAHELFADLDKSELLPILDGLLRVREVAEHPQGSFGFSVSAREILGSSKILDRLPHSARRILGVSKLPATPRYVVVAGPPEPEAVLLIENSTTYEEAVRAGLGRSVALIAAYGYGLNMMSDSAAGWALVESLTNGRCEVLSRSGQNHRLAGLLDHPKLYFWGDLDREGLRIALALRTSFSHLKLSAFYQPMVALARGRTTSHPYALFCGKANQQPWRDSGDVQFDALAGVCASRAVDQEALDLCLHAGLVAEVLSMVPESIQE